MPVPRELQASFPPSITGQGSQALPGCVMGLQENSLTRTRSGWHWVPREGPLGAALTLLPLALLPPGLPQRSPVEIPTSARALLPILGVKEPRPPKEAKLAGQSGALSPGPVHPPLPTPASQDLLASARETTPHADV